MDYHQTFKLLISIASIAFIILLAPASGLKAEVAEYIIDPGQSQITFKVKHMLISNIRGSFDLFEGYYELDSEMIENSNVIISVTASSVNTNNDKRDELLKSSDFLDVQNYPDITFKSKDMKLGEGNEFEIVGDLTIHGVTKEVMLDAVYEGPNESNFLAKDRSAFRVHGEISRKDFGLNWDNVIESMGFVVGDKVKFTVEVEGIRKPSY